MAHPAEVAGDRAGRAAAYEDLAIEKVRRGGDELLTAAADSAADWLEGAGLFVDRSGASRAAYLCCYLAAYAAVWQEPPAS